MRSLTRNKSQLPRMVMLLVLAGVLLFSFVGLAREIVVASTAVNRIRSTSATRSGSTSTT